MWRLNVLLGLATLAAAPLAAQLPVGVGLKVGAPINDVFKTSNIDNFSVTSFTDRLVIGPAFELRLPFGVGFELDFLFRKAGIQAALAGTATSADDRIYEIPVLFKYRPGSGMVRPYFVTGASFRRLGDVSRVAQFIRPNQNQQLDRNSTGFVVGGGLELRLLILRISPEVRFTRWGTNTLGEGLRNALSVNRNQADFLVGISF